MARWTFSSASPAQGARVLHASIEQGTTQPNSPVTIVSRPIQPSYQLEQPPLRCSFLERISSLRPSLLPSPFPRAPENGPVARRIHLCRRSKWRSDTAPELRSSRHRNRRLQLDRASQYRIGRILVSVSPDSGSSSSTSFGTVTVSANPAGLAPGVYYGLVVVLPQGP